MNAEQEQILARYLNKGFTNDQLEEISKGIEAGYDVSIYARKTIPASDMAYIRKYLTAKANIEPKEEVEENFELIEKEYQEYKEAIQISVFEKIVVFAITISGLAIIVAMFAMIVSWPIVFK